MKIPSEFIRIAELSSFPWTSSGLNVNELNVRLSEIVNFYLSKQFSDVVVILDELFDFVINMNLYNGVKFDNNLSKFYADIRNAYFSKFFEIYKKDIDSNDPIEIAQKYINHFKGFYSLSSYQIVVNEGAILHRARLGAREEIGKIDGFDVSFKYPYFDTAIKNPPSSLASEGRFNRSGFSYYYLSSADIGAVAEVRPSTGSTCSVAKFLASKNLKMMHLGKIQELSEFIMTPVGEDKRHYRYSQFFSDVMRACGFEGIQYYASKTGLYCIVCFYTKSIDYINGSEKLLDIGVEDNLISIHYPEFLKYEHWERIQPKDDRMKVLFEKIIEHEKSGVYRKDDISFTIEALRELDGIED